MPGWKGSTRRRRLPPDWHTVIRPRILARDRGICHVCGRLGAEQVDHLKAGDDHRDANLAAICEPCHRTKSGREGAAAAHARRRPRRRPPEPHPGQIK